MSARFTVPGHCAPESFRTATPHGRFYSRHLAQRTPGPFVAILHYLVAQTEIDNHPSAEQLARRHGVSVSKARRALRWAKQHAGLEIRQCGRGRGSTVKYAWQNHAFWRPAWHRRESSQVVKSEHLGDGAVRNISFPEETTVSQEQCSVVVVEQTTADFVTDPVPTENPETPDPEIPNFQEAPDSEILEARTAADDMGLPLTPRELEILRTELQGRLPVLMFLACMIRRIDWRTLESPIAYLRTSARDFAPRQNERRILAAKFAPSPPPPVEQTGTTEPQYQPIQEDDPVPVYAAPTATEVREKTIRKLRDKISRKRDELAKWDEMLAGHRARGCSLPRFEAEGQKIAAELAALEAELATVEGSQHERQLDLEVD